MGFVKLCWSFYFASTFLTIDHIRNAMSIIVKDAFKHVQTTNRMYKLLLVGGLEHDFYFPIYW